MLTHDIKCGSCGREGKMDAYNVVYILPQSERFQFLARDSSSGFMHFRCPSCKVDLVVDPVNVIDASQIVGYPASR
jgi:hypothetical protein